MARRYTNLNIGLGILMITAVTVGLPATQALAGGGAQSSLNDQGRVGPKVSKPPWGDLALLIGWWSSVDATTGKTALSHYEWEGRDTKLIAEHHFSSGGINTDIFTLDASSSTINMIIRVPNTEGDIPTGTFTDLKRKPVFNPDGSMHIETKWSDGSIERETRKIKEGEGFTVTYSNFKDGAWKETSVDLFRKVPSEVAAILVGQQKVNSEQIALAEASLRAKKQAQRFAKQQRLRDEERARMEEDEEAYEAEEEMAEAQSRAASQPNAYTILRGLADAATVNAQNAEANLQNTIARAQAQARREEAEQARQARNQEAAAQRQEAATQEQARAALARTLANAEAVRAQQMAAARANGDVARQQQLAEQSRTAQGYAQQYGDQDSVRQQQATQQNAQAAQERQRLAQENARKAAEQQSAARHQAAAANEERTRLAQAERVEQQRRREEDRLRPVEFKEGIVLCQLPAGSRQSRCQGPLQTTYVVFNTSAGDAALGQACGSGKSIRDLGLSSGYRAFGCGFGIHPTAHDYPGNIDVPALLGVYVSGRATFRCPASTLAYCRGS